MNMLFLFIHIFPAAEDRIVQDSTRVGGYDHREAEFPDQRQGRVLYVLPETEWMGPSVGYVAPCMHHVLTREWMAAIQA